MSRSENRPNTTRIAQYAAASRGDLCSHRSAKNKAWGKRRMRRDDRISGKLELREELEMMVDLQRNPIKYRTLRRMEATKEIFQTFMEVQCLDVIRPAKGRKNCYVSSDDGSEIRIASCAPQTRRKPHKQRAFV